MRAAPDSLVSGERSDIRQTSSGLRIYTDEGIRDVSVEPKPTGRDHLLAEAYEAIVNGKQPAHGAAWGLANLEGCLAILESARTHREVSLRHQVTSFRD